jgi:hypothetical protein
VSFACAAGPCQCSLSRVLVPWDLCLYFTVSDLRLPFSSPPTTRRVTVEVFDSVSTQVQLFPLLITTLHGSHRKHPVFNSNSIVVCAFVAAERSCSQSHGLATGLQATIHRPGPPGLGLLCQADDLALWLQNPKRWKPGCNLAESSEEGCGSQRTVLQMMMMIRQTKELREP